jgi:hypothetical protein
MISPWNVGLPKNYHDSPWSHSAHYQIHTICTWIWKSILYFLACRIKLESACRTKCPGENFPWHQRDFPTGFLVTIDQTLVCYDHHKPEIGSATDMIKLFSDFSINVLSNYHLHFAEIFLTFPYWMHFHDIREFTPQKLIYKWL